MPACTINGTAFSGTVHDSDSILRAPMRITPRDAKIGPLLTLADGSEMQMIRVSPNNPTGHREWWELEWQRVPRATYDAVRAIGRLNTTFTFVFEGVSYTGQCLDQDWAGQQDDDAVLIDRRYYDLTLTIRRVWP